MPHTASGPRRAVTPRRSWRSGPVTPASTPTG